jgi:hypothetical protein
VVTVHSGEEQLLTPHLTEERFGGRDLTAAFASSSACSRHKRQYPCLIGTTRPQAAHWPAVWRLRKV